MSAIPYPESSGDDDEYGSDFEAADALAAAEQSKHPAGSGNGYPQGGGGGGGSYSSAAQSGNEKGKGRIVSFLYLCIDFIRVCMFVCM